MAVITEEVTSKILSKAMACSHGLMARNMQVSGTRVSSMAKAITRTSKESKDWGIGLQVGVMGHGSIPMLFHSRLSPCCSNDVIQSSTID